MMRLTYILLLMIASLQVRSQNDSLNDQNDSLPGRLYLLQSVERDGVTLPEIEIREVTIIARTAPEKKSEVRRFERLAYNIKKVYPYALIVRHKLHEVNSQLVLLENDKERREYLREFEKNVFGEYEDDIKNMTITQGRLLIKLIDRETQNTSYNLIREYKGRLSAAFWQGIARIFGTNLKDEYDPFGNDILIEMILNDIEMGRL
jgi:hypothetical protein